MIVVAVVWWALVLGGLVPATLFLVRFHPRWPLRRPSLIVSGLVLVVWLMYVRSAAAVAAGGWVPRYRDGLGLVIELAVIGVADWLLILMLSTFLRYRRQWRKQRHGGRADSRKEE